MEVKIKFVNNFLKGNTFQENLSMSQNFHWNAWEKVKSLVQSALHKA